MAATILYGLLAAYAVWHIRQWRYRMLGAVVAGVLIVLVGFSRIYLGAHYFSDVTGGYAAGAAWLAAWLAFMQTLRHYPPEAPVVPPSMARERAGVWGPAGERS